MAAKVSAELNSAIDGFLEKTAEMSAHMNNNVNPHNITKEQVGLGNLTNDKQATEAQLQAHTGNAGNPHSVTKAQVGLSNVSNDKQATEADFNAHTANASNPHAVTKTQVGLGNVLNEEQATRATYNAHVSDMADKHAVTGITYDATRNLKQYLDALQLGSGSGTMDHSLLVNRDLANAHPISAISGLSESLKHIYTFMGITTDTTETELFTTDTGEYIDSNGRIKVPKNAALGIDIKFVWAVKADAGPGGIIAKKYATQSVCASRYSSRNTYLESTEAVVIGTASLTETTFGITANNATVDDGDGSLSLKVTGVNSSTKPVYWKAIVTITPIAFSEFE